jgi:predicted transcriptional regulator
VKYLPKPKRNKLEIYNDILNAVVNVLANNNEAKPTRVQLQSNLSYDKLARYLNELEDKKLITQDPLLLSQRGNDFLQDYQRIADFVREMGVKYMDFSEEGIKQ